MESNSTTWMPMKMIVGAFIALMGVVMTLDNFYLFDAEHVLQFWSLFLVAIGVKYFFEGRLFGAFAWTFAGIWILLYNFDLVHWDIFGFWPIILVGIGIVLVRQAIAPANGSREAGSVDTAHAVAVLCGVKKSSQTESFSGGSATTCVGHSLVDLSSARMQGNLAYFDAYAFMGAVELIVPREWRVTSELFPFMGAFEDKTKPAANADRQLHIRGAVCMGSIEVRNGEEQ